MWSKERRWKRKESRPSQWEECYNDGNKQKIRSRKHWEQTELGEYSPKVGSVSCLPVPCLNVQNCVCIMPSILLHGRRTRRLTSWEENSLKTDWPETDEVGGTSERVLFIWYQQDCAMEEMMSMGYVPTTTRSRWLHSFEIDR
jgi:hypothetical protein